MQRSVVVTTLAALGLLGICTTMYLHFHLHTDPAGASADRRIAEVQARCTTPPPCPLCTPAPREPCPACLAGAAAASPAKAAACPLCPLCENATAAVGTTTPCPQGDTEYVHPCAKKSAQVRAGYTKGVTPHLLRRSRARHGNTERLRKFLQKLESGEPVNVAVFGGSITRAHGVTNDEGWAFQFGQLLDNVFPTAHGKPRHNVVNLAVHGANICYLEKRLKLMLDFLATDRGMPQPDAVFLEYAVNDYEGQDDRTQLFFIEDVFFDGFQEIATCAEGIVRGLYEKFPDIFLLFAEFKTAIEKRQTAQFLHMAVAQHYDVPVISYADAVLLPFFHQVAKLHPKHWSIDTSKGADGLVELPFGCSPDYQCHPQKLVGFPCRELCKLYRGSQAPQCLNLPPGHKPCFMQLFVADEVHPSWLGHKFMTDLVTDLVISELESQCRNEEVHPSYMPNDGLMTTPVALRGRANFLLVNETQMVSPKHVPDLTPTGASQAWQLIAERYDKYGWMSTVDKAGEMIEFGVDLPVGQSKCYTIFLGVLRSYEGMGKYLVRVTDHSGGGKKTERVLDGQWTPHISVWSEDMVTSDDPKKPDCTGKCSVQVFTMAKEVGRTGNKVKILTLSARECLPAD
mmetsp:Transcript_14053/g.41750  ORF Transcript_14053/g.41750 Transcript_14053/m.41750 type:complete len:627 (-) Transcript_14053:2135-4015(-)